MSPFDRSWPVADAVTLACTMEAAATKVGNVHPGKSFAQTHFGHFAASAVAIHSCFANPAKSVGELVLNCVEATLTNVGSNTNLGMLLLFAPLAVARNRGPANCSVDELHQHVVQVLESLTAADAAQVYAAIRRANPGGLGDRDTGDVKSADAASLDLRQAMAQVATFDAVARQYINGYADVFTKLLPWFDQQLETSLTPIEAIERLHLLWLAHEPDGLIVRKVGQAIADEAQQLAQHAVAELFQCCAAKGDPQKQPRSELASRPAVQQLDSFLRADGNQRNPGTTADLIAATIFGRLLIPR